MWLYELDVAGTCRFTARRSDYFVDLPLDPMHGTVGVAPAAGEVLMSITPAGHGGNMDTPELRSGVTAYFPVNVAGGLLEAAAAYDGLHDRLRSVGADYLRTR